MINWVKKWFYSDERSVQEQFIELAAISGASNASEKIDLARQKPIRCLKCKRFMGQSDGMQIIVDSNWRLHINCFGPSVDELLKEIESAESKGELILDHGAQ